MNTIVSLSLSKLSTGEVHHTVSALSSILDGLRGDPHIERQLLPIEQANRFAQEIMQAPKASSKTDVINSTDDELDSLLPVIVNSLEVAVAQSAFFPEKADAAERLLTRIALCDKQKLFYGGYGDQAAQLENLLGDLLGETFAAALALSGIAPLVNHLQELHKTLQQLLTERLQEEKLSSNRREQRKIINYRLDKLIAYLDANITDKVDGFPAVQEPVNELFTEVMALYKGRMTRKANAE